MIPLKTIENTMSLVKSGVINVCQVEAKTNPRLQTNVRTPHAGFSYQHYTLVRNGSYRQMQATIFYLAITFSNVMEKSGQNLFFQAI